MDLFRRLRIPWADRPAADRPDGTGNPGRAAAGPTVPAARSADDATPAPASLDPAALPRCFGPVPNHAHSPLPVLDADGQVVPGTGIRKFVDPLPTLRAAGSTGTTDATGASPTGGGPVDGLPIAAPDTITYPGCDYYEIGLREYAQRLHRDLPATRLRGYRQLNLGTDPTGHNTLAPPERPVHLGPVIVARRGRPVRVKFINQLPTGRAGELFLPVDPTIEGAGTGPLDGPAPYPQNRAVLHLAGAQTGWISAGNPWQWITPAGEITPYPTGVGLTHVPDMPHPGAGATTLYYPNDQSGRLLTFQDNTVGLARLTVYTGQLALYLLTDPAEERLVADGVLPADQIPLVFEDRTFVPDDTQLAGEDPTWDRDRWGARGSLWHPHVYQPRQNPHRSGGGNPTGRWDYGPWSRTAEETGPDGESWPNGAAPATGPGPVPNPHHDPVTAPDEPPVTPGVPHPSAVPAAYGDTVLVNGVAYPWLAVEPRAYRFRILNACPDRSLNLQLYRARAAGPLWDPDGALADPGAGEVPMVEAVRTPDRPAGWPADGREGGVPDPRAAGPELVQIGNEGGLLPAPVVIPNQPVTYRYDRRDPTVLNVDGHALLLAPGEQADVLVDFSTVAPGGTLILYNDAPAPLPGFDPRYDHHTDAPDLRAEGGTPPSRPGYGPNTRTLLQFRVSGTPAPRYDLARLRERLPRAYAASQRPPIVPQPAYDAALGTRTARETVVPVHATTVSFTPIGGGSPVLLPLAVKAVQQVFEPGHGRLAGRLGVGHPHGGPLGPAVLPLGPTDPATEVVQVSDPAAPVGAPGDGTQLWRIRGASRQTQPVRLDGVDLQLVNRAGWDGTLRPPDENELGWKQVVRVNPREDVIVALRPVAPSLPFKIGDSVRLLDPGRPAGARTGSTPVSPVDGRPALVVNQLVNLGWEYRWHSQLAGHRDQGMSRPLVLRVAPKAPTGLTATPAPGSATALPAITLAWTGNGSRPAAASHLLQRATDPTFTEGLTGITVAATATRYTDATVTPGVTYHYRIRAENSVSCSAWSNSVPASVQLAAPAGLAAAVPPAAPLRVALRWRNRSFATGIDVQRATNPTFTSGPGTTAIGVGDTHLDTAVAPDTIYYYRVRTTYLGAASPWSTVAQVTTPPRPGVPTSVSVTATAPAPDTASVILGWTASTPAGQGAGFTVQRALDAAFTREVATFTVSGRGFTNTGLVRGVTYHYRIRSFNVVGTSAFSTPVAVTTPQ
ncbi:hypothetical protein GKC29_27135 [Micromonospora sp. WMMC415]|uniref:hypothetical protein n=1 Tax=Micromonospora sp. WMMC415 TaxID=2675222 RepID=UPI0012B501D1|nr:hypothetical protein [Micromonospora sp. WMMC415]QGN50130.1 hypothetical protein GKC29_27135 [Micromonospora sp. WMMC415]